MRCRVSARFAYLTMTVAPKVLLVRMRAGIVARRELALVDAAWVRNGWPAWLNRTGMLKPLRRGRSIQDVLMMGSHFFAAAAIHHLAARGATIEKLLAALDLLNRRFRFDRHTVS